MTRTVWFTDRYGREVEEDITIDRLAELLETIAAADGDDEHVVISVSDSDAWGLEFSRETVVFENVEPGGENVGTIRGATRAERLAMGTEFLAGDFAALRSRPWRTETAPGPSDMVLGYLRGHLLGMLQAGDLEVRHIVEAPPGERRRIETRVYRPGGSTESVDGAYDVVEGPRVLGGAMDSLRSAMSGSGAEPWTRAELRVAADGTMTTSFGQVAGGSHGGAQL